MLAEPSRFEDLVFNLSAFLSDVPPTEMNREIIRCLDFVRNSSGIDCCALMEVEAAHGRIRTLVMSRDEDSERQAHSMQTVNRFPWVYRRLVEEGQPMFFPSREKLPPEADGERAFWENSGIKTMLMIPLRSKGEVTHIFGLANRRQGNEWPGKYPRMLRVVGDMIVRELILRSHREKLSKIERETAGVRGISNLGSWEWDLIQGIGNFSDVILRNFGLTPGQPAMTREAFYQAIHPEDRDRLREAVARSGSDPTVPYYNEHRAIRPDGSVRVVRAWAEVIRDGHGKALGLRGKAWDITDRKGAEEDLGKALREFEELREILTVEKAGSKGEDNSRSDFPDIIGESAPLKYVLHRVRQVARTKTTVLFLGETGTGKGLFARSLHDASDRKDKPFVNVNCAGLPANLIESELFGREKGAFTGSTARQIGRFELANGGTIFLDEIAELPLDLQSKLLKVIEGGEFERLGSPRTVKVDVHIVACTNRHIEGEVRTGRFRRDLFYRLNVFPITIPPLRERKQDIPLLVRFYAEKFGRAQGKVRIEFLEDTMQALENYSWPGNVRELINIVERAVILSDGPELRLPEKISAEPSDLAQEDMPIGVKETMNKGLVEIEREHILTTLRGKGWLIDGHNGAAQLLGVNPSTLRSKMKKLGIARPG